MVVDSPLERVRAPRLPHVHRQDLRLRYWGQDELVSSTGKAVGPLGRQAILSFRSSLERRVPLSVSRLPASLRAGRRFTEPHRGVQPR